VFDQGKVFLRGRCTLRWAETVLAAQALQKRLQGLGQSLIGGGQIGPLCVSSIRWDRDAAQNGCRRWVVRSRHIGVPACPWALLGLAVVAVGFAMLGNRVQLGIAFYMTKHRV